MIERSNGILESVLRKSCNNPGEWDIPLPTSAHNANQRIIHHLGHSPTEIFLGIQPNPLPQFQVEGTSDLVILHRKESGKLEPRWKGPFTIEKFAGSYGKSYKTRQIGGKVIKGAFYRDHPKDFVPGRGHLRGPSETALPHNQTISKPRSGEG